MTPEDVKYLLEQVELFFPRQEMPEREFKRWVLLLADTPATVGDVDAALVGLARRQSFVEPHEVIAAIGAIRRDRIERAPVEVFTDRDLDRPQLREALRAVADGGVGLGAVLGALEGPEKGPGINEEARRARVLVNGRTPEFERLRGESRAFPCEQCGARPGDLCVNAVTGKPLEQAPAHRSRLEGAGLVQAQPVLTREDYLAMLQDRMGYDGT